jgi:hypothetical protein
MFEGLELEVMLYDEYVDMLLEDDDEDEDDGLYRKGAGGLYNTGPDAPDFAQLLRSIEVRKVAFYHFSFVGEFKEHPGYSLVSSSSMVFICTMPYAKLRRVIGEYLSARMS